MAEDDSNINPIEDAFKKIKSESSVSQQLFVAVPEDVDLKTDVIYPEDVYISTLKFTDDFLVSKGLKEVYSSYIEDLLRVRFSLDRKSRSEFVSVNARPLHNLQFPAEQFKSIEEARK